MYIGGHMEMMSPHGGGLASSGELDRKLRQLQDHAGPPSMQPRESAGDYSTADEDRARARLSEWDMSIIPSSLPPATVSAAIKAQIVKNRVTRTATSRAVEAEICQVLAASSLPSVAMRALFERVWRLFEAVAVQAPCGSKSWLLPSEVDLGDLDSLRKTGNQRQHFHALRALEPPLRCLLRRLAVSSQEDPLLLSQLGDLGVIDPSRVAALAERIAVADGNTDLILSAPESLRRIWTRAAHQRRGPPLWYYTGLRVKDATMPPVSEAEVRALFGPAAALNSHGDRRLPYECGAYKYALVEDDPLVVACTNKGLFATSGPSGTAYRFLNLWLVLAGPEAELAVIRLAVASLLLSGSHHSLAEIMMVCAPLMGCRPPEGLADMIEQLVPHELRMMWEGVSHTITPVKFRSELARRLDRVLA
ncbi:hypothetical protein B0H66DRAFT_547259 [Apodospora peruviana]|uniref:Uncharacterized protein n=1 Tax=Apodospora peruviana TaxID=516989 RepID=A0AAE0MA48_9PEZI|nr:hypothetical protein B0H66DRAFT_547259 [Apodospora peruviana]